MTWNADDQLAGVDLDAWCPPAPPPAPLEAVLSRYREEEDTRLDAATAVDSEGVEDALTPSRPPASRMKWLAIGIVIGCVAASLVAIVSVTIARSVSDKPSEALAPPAPTADHRPAPTPAPAPAPAGSVDLGKLRFADLQAAVKRYDPQLVIMEFAKISPDSIYYEPAKQIHDAFRERYIEEQVEWATARARARAPDCGAIATRAAQIGKLWEEAATALRAIECTPSRTTGRRSECRVDTDCNGADVCKRSKCVVPATAGTCNATALLEEVKTAYGNNQWARMLRKSEEANRCAPSRYARNLALRAACRLMNKAKAMKYWKEFENDQGARQACVGVVDAPPF